MVRPTKFEIDQTLTGHSLVVAVRGELDMNTTKTLIEHLDRALDNAITSLTLDLRELTFMDSSGVQLLIELNDRSRTQSWRLALLAPTTEAAALVLHVTGVDAALPFEREDD